MSQLAPTHIPSVIQLVAQVIVKCCVGADANVAKFMASSGNTFGVTLHYPKP